MPAVAYGFVGCACSEVDVAQVIVGQSGAACGEIVVVLLFGRGAEHDFEVVGLVEGFVVGGKNVHCPHVVLVVDLFGP